MSSPNPQIRRNPVFRVQPTSYIKQSQQKQSYLSRLPFWRRYPRGSAFGGAFITFCIVYSCPIYYFMRTPPEHINPADTMWPGERSVGKTYVEQFKEKRQKMHEAKERFMTEAKAKEANKEK